MKRILTLPLALALSACSPSSPFPGVAVGAKIRVELSDNKTKTGWVEEISNKGVLIRTPQPPPTRTTRGLPTVAELQAEVDNKLGLDAVKTFIPWSSITSVRIMIPALAE